MIYYTGGVRFWGFQNQTLDIDVGIYLNPINIVAAFTNHFYYHSISLGLHRVVPTKEEIVSCTPSASISAVLLCTVRVVESGANICGRECRRSALVNVC